jgi:putative Flp pilus-assembly TadE/G-like protein
MAVAPNRSASHRLTSERGSVLVQVGVAMIVLIAFLSFVADYGLMWVARRQAQNAADAGALAGAVALGYDDFVDRFDTGPAKQSAHKVAMSHFVAGETPKVNITTDVFFYQDDPDKFPDECADDTCIRVDVYRNIEGGNPLPVWFGQLVGLVNQGVRATAIARASFGNASDCLKPWAVVDRWEEHWHNMMTVPFPPNSWDADSTFDKYKKDGPDIVLDPAITTPDVYEPPYVAYNTVNGVQVPDWSTYDAGSGFHPYDINDDGSVGGYTDDYGRQIFLKQGDAGDWNMGAGWFMRLNLAPFDTDEDGTPCTGKGAKCYEQQLAGCVGITYKIGDDLEIDNANGSATGPTIDGVEAIIASDENAKWYDPDGDGPKPGYIIDSMFDSSPRIVAVPMVNPDVLIETFKNGNRTVPIANIAGFFIEGVSGKGGNQYVYGRLMTIPSLKTEGGGGEAPSTFMRNISLIR